MTRKTLSNTLANFSANEFFNDKKMKELASAVRKAKELQSTLEKVVNTIQKVACSLNCKQTSLVAAVDDNKVATSKKLMTELEALIGATESQPIIKTLLEKFTKEEAIDTKGIDELFSDLN